MAGGKGTRLDPFKGVAETLIPIGEQTMIEKIINVFGQGFEKFFTVNYKSSII